MKLGNELEQIISVDTDQFCLYVRFRNGVEGKIGLEDIFSHPRGLAAEILRGNMFDRCFVEGGALAWPNGLELCPDMLIQRMESDAQVA